MSDIIICEVNSNIDHENLHKYLHAEHYILILINVPLQQYGQQSPHYQSYQTHTPINSRHPPPPPRCLLVWDMISILCVIEIIREVLVLVGMLVLRPSSSWLLCSLCWMSWVSKNNNIWKSSVQTWNIGWKVELNEMRAFVIIEHHGHQLDLSFCRTGAGPGVRQLSPWWRTRHHSLNGSISY